MSRTEKQKTKNIAKGKKTEKEKNCPFLTCEIFI